MITKEDYQDLRAGRLEDHLWPFFVRAYAVTAGVGVRVARNDAGLQERWRERHHSPSHRREFLRYVYGVSWDAEEIQDAHVAYLEEEFLRRLEPLDDDLRREINGQAGCCACAKGRACPAHDPPNT